MSWSDWENCTFGPCNFPWSDLILKSSCISCGSAQDLYGSACKHLTLCLMCGKSMVEKRSKCYQCGVPIRPPFIREYNIRACSSNEKKEYFLGRFTSGLPSFKSKNENKWTLQKEVTDDTLREECKNKPWLLKDETGQFEYKGQLEGSHSSTYYLLMLQGKEFVGIPAASCYNFKKVAKEKMMKAANNGAEAEKFYVREGAGSWGRKKTTGEDDDSDDIKKGDDEEIFTDDDWEAVGDDPEEFPAPPEIKQQLNYTFIQRLKSHAKLWVARG